MCSNYNIESYLSFLIFLILPCLVAFCSSGLLDPGMLVNIQQPVIQADGTLLLATDTKVTSFYSWVFLYICSHGDQYTN